jgi:hypothetical protein
LKASLAIEAIGQNSIRDIRSFDRFLSNTVGLKPDLMPWRHGVWLIGWRKATPLNGKWDYAKANSKGSRGVYIHYILESGNLYQVASPCSWKTTDHYFCTVSDDGDIVKMTQEEAFEWLRNR